MILYPSIDKLVGLVDSKYTLVIASSKRARALQEGAKATVPLRTGKFVSVALRELEEGTILYRRTKEGIK